MDDSDRAAGEGTLDQIRGDLESLEALGAEYVLLDTYFDVPEATKDHEAAWHMPATLADKVQDLGNETMR